MNCPIQHPETTEILLDFCAGKLPADTAAQLQRHIDACADCREFSQRQSQVWSDLDAWEAGPVSASFDSRLYARIAEVEQRPSWKQRLAGRASWRPVMVAGLATAAVVIALVVPSPHRDSVAPPLTPVENSRADSIEPEQVEKTLEDLDMLNQLSSSTTQDL